MSAPLKPWERTGYNTSGNTAINDGRQTYQQLDPLNQSAIPGTSSSPAGPPPVPMRPNAQSSTFTGGLSGYNNGYGSYNGMSNYGGLSSYGGFGSGSMCSPYGSNMYGNSMYGGYGSMGMNRFNQGDVQSNSFVRMAEENSQQAFQSIEGIVQAFGSVAMMLESTYSAVYNSFRAVIGVADHFSRMKANLSQIFSALAIVRTLKWILRKLLVLIRLKESTPNDEVWMEAVGAVGGIDTNLPGSKKPNTSWPILLFFAVIMGGPWLIWRFLSSLTQKQADNNAWASAEAEHFVALAEYDFDGEKDDELSFRRGQRIIVAPKELQQRVRGWLVASVDGKQVGIIPANYVKILGRHSGSRSVVVQKQQIDSSQQSTGPAPLPSQVPVMVPGDTTVDKPDNYADVKSNIPVISKDGELSKGRDELVQSNMESTFCDINDGNIC